MNDAPRTKTISVAALARVEGEGALTIRMQEGQVADVQLRIFEPPRFYEAFLRRRALQEVPDITARICGICPVAYQMSSVHALEKILGVTLPPPLRALRRMLYCGEWIESHVLHVYMLHAPDFLGYESAIALAQSSPANAAIVREALRLKKAGNAIVNLVGGREVHPINVRVGGFYRAPTAAEMKKLAEQLRSVLDVAIETVKFTASLNFPDFTNDYEFVCLRHPQEYPMNEGRVVSSAGLDIAQEEYPVHFEEYQVPHSNALQARRKPGHSAYFVGPLARWNLNADRASPLVRELAAATGISFPNRNPFISIVVRALETVLAIEEALRIADNYQPPDYPFVAWQPRAGVGHAVTEAPRGILYHRYETDEAGLLTNAVIVPPTSQNQAQMEDDLRRLAPSLVVMPDDQATHRAEHAIRNYDPCISCATHFLKLKVEGR